MLTGRAEAALHGSGRYRILITVAGVPGSGKTTLAAGVADALNARHGPGFAAVVPMDGYHLTRAQLDKFADPADAHYHRGRHDTFDSQGVVSLARRIYKSGSMADGKLPATIHAPSFDHAVKDPVDNGIEVPPAARIVIMEGLYLLMNEQPWDQISKYSAEKWMVTVSEEVALTRLAKRHLAAGIVSTLEAGRDRAAGNDAVNGRYLLSHSVEPDVTIRTG